LVWPGGTVEFYASVINLASPNAVEDKPMTSRFNARNNKLKPNKKYKIAPIIRHLGQLMPTTGEINLFAAFSTVFQALALKRSETAITPHLFKQHCNIRLWVQFPI